MGVGAGGLVKFNFNDNQTKSIDTSVGSMNNNSNSNTSNNSNSAIITNNTLIDPMADAVVSYGLICYYNKKIVVPDDNLNSGFFNKRTKKHNTGNIKRPYQRGIHNLPRIKILKRNETLSHTLKNMLGITNSQTDNENVELDLEADMLDNIVDEGDMVGAGQSLIEADGDMVEEDGDNKEISCQKVILVQRRNTIGFIEFMRGKYEVYNHEYIIKLFNMLTFDEKRILREYDSFDTIRKIIGLGRENNYRKEYDDAKLKFEDLRGHANGNMIFKLLD
jgi:hypothetical protein